MALDFPSSPTNGQVFGAYTYDSTAGAWRSSALYSLGVATGGTANQFLTKIDSSNYNTQWSTTLGVANGGTGANTLTSGAYLKGAGTSAITSQTGIPATDITSGALAIARGGTGVTTGAGVTPILPTSATTGSVDSVGTVTFTNQSSISVNGAFTSAYSRYRIFVNFTTSNMTGTNTTWVLRASGTNNTTSNYSYNGYRFMDWAPAQLNAKTGASWLFIDSNAQTGTSYLQGYTDIMYPQQSSITFMSHVSNLYGSGGFDGSTYLAGMFNGTNSFDGFSIIFSTANSSTGTIKIYGYN
jgi:hypothetical protein